MGRIPRLPHIVATILTFSLILSATPAQEQRRPALLKRMHYNHPGLVVDLAVGLSSIPVPVTGNDGRVELLVGSTGRDYTGVFHFNRTTDPLLLAPGEPAPRPRDVRSMQSSFAGGRWWIIADKILFAGHAGQDFQQGAPIPYEPTFKAGSKWHLFDYDSDGASDLIIAGADADSPAPPSGFVPEEAHLPSRVRYHLYWIRNEGTDEAPRYAAARKVLGTDGQPLTFSSPVRSAMLGDFSGDGLPDLVCAVGLDSFQFHANAGRPSAPAFAPPQPMHYGGETIHVDNTGMSAAAVDWDDDGHLDLLVGVESGCVFLIRHAGWSNAGIPQFLPPIALQQYAHELKSGSLVTPCGYDLDGDGDDDLVCGNSSGFVVWFENLGGTLPSWGPMRYLMADHEVIRVIAGSFGAIQGPSEAKWGYTTVCVADWDHDGLPDLLVNSSWGRIRWYRNLGPRSQPFFAAAAPIEVEPIGVPLGPPWNTWQPPENELATQWRTSVQALDLTGDGLIDLVALDADGFLVLYERARKDDRLVLLPARRAFEMEPGAVAVFDYMQRPVVFDRDGNGINDLSEIDAEGRLFSHFMVPGGDRTIRASRHVVRAGDPRYRDPIPPQALRLNGGWAGRSGRRKFTFADWDGDGRLDLIVNGDNANLLLNVSTSPGRFIFRDLGPLDGLQLAGHTTAPTTVDFDRDGIRDLVLGGENGFLYFLRNPRSAFR